MAELIVGNEAIDADEAFHAVVGYAFARRALPMKQRPVVGPAVGRKEVFRWAYRTYDCVPGDPAPTLEGVDLFVAEGLNGRLTADTVASLIAVAPEVNESLGSIHNDLTFWDLKREEVVSALERTQGWPLWRAWSILMSAPHIDIAVTHKTLHHKRPRVFPLLDNQTFPALNLRENAWVQIHDELNDDPDAWNQLEARFDSQTGRAPTAVSLTRLRLHDIILWLRVQDRSGSQYGFCEAVLHGQRLL